MLRTCLLYVARADARRGAAASEEKQATCEDGESPMAVDSGEYAPPYEIVGPRHQILVHTRMVRILFATSSTDTSTSSVSSHSGFTLAMTTRDLLFFRESPFEVVPRTQLFLRSPVIYIRLSVSPSSGLERAKDRDTTPVIPAGTARQLRT